ncbi:hypothetical protein ABTY61_32375 [Kitasatospora sp. NPDC096128]|uniref:MmyB family transcriptional regulator n=1 Tax=Kitasatospora sp. NPDC096128 TaxID=3155547 RepID=UPI003318C2CF
MSQEVAAAELGFSARWYGILERNGHDMALDTEVLERLAGVLRMNAHDRHTLFLLNTGKEPPSGSLDFPSAAIVQAVLNTSPYPAYVSNKRWDIEQYNEAWMRVWGDGPVPSNVVLYVLTEHRVRDTVLRNWASGWALPILRQVRAALLTWPADDGLKRLQQEVETAAAQDPVLADLCREAWNEEYIHGSGDTRLLDHAEWGPCEITLMMLRGLDPESGHRIVWIVPPGADWHNDVSSMLTSLRLLAEQVTSGGPRHLLVGGNGEPPAVLLPLADYQRLVAGSAQSEMREPAGPVGTRCPELAPDTGNRPVEPDAAASPRPDQEAAGERADPGGPGTG